MFECKNEDCFKYLKAIKDNNADLFKAENKKTKETVKWLIKIECYT